MRFKVGVYGQSLGEYAVLIALVLAVLTAMQAYVKRGLQGRVKDAADFAGNALMRSAGLEGRQYQYEPGFASSLTFTSTNKQEDKSLIAGEYTNIAFTEKFTPVDTTNVIGIKIVRSED